MSGYNHSEWVGMLRFRHLTQHPTSPCNIIGYAYYVSYKLMTFRKILKDVLDMLIYPFFIQWHIE